ncbi:electron transfer flavoprotein subunit alpha/FixB family protein [Aeromonas molluscorum]|uniref:Electron transfer flavoprotein subunit alpha n=1 Tax=Aeromonas molluscorum 848 TaxID=1268236 RepID=R1GVG2_9GAMM|nr:FAD-binding protein [Aeromonas molluscorum]EOD55575.1 electron transfer flavoprotein alpha-subunit [Aeromonas molluscorum 848]
MSILIIAQQAKGPLAVSTAQLVGAAKALQGDIHLLLLGDQITQAATEAARLQGVTRVRLAELGCNWCDGLDKPLAALAQDYHYVLMAASSTAKDLLPRMAARLGMEMLSEVIAIEGKDSFLRPIYAGNAIARVQSSAPIKLMTLRASSFPTAVMGEVSAPVEALPSLTIATRTRLVSRQAVVSSRPELGSARVVVSGGRALGSKAQFALIEALADKLGGAVGASRAAVDAGFVGNDLQVGQTGKVVAPELYIAVGISGAIQHLAGMKESKVIVAINKDGEAPIFQIADYGLVGDLFTLLPELTAKL